MSIPLNAKDLPAAEFPHGVTIAELKALSEEQDKLRAWNRKGGKRTGPTMESDSLERIQSILDMRNRRHPEFRPFAFHYKTFRVVAIWVYPTTYLIAQGWHDAPNGVRVPRYKEPKEAADEWDL